VSARRPRSKLRPRYLRVHATLVFLFLFAPIVVLVVFSFNSGRSSAAWQGFSTKWYSALADNEQALDAFRLTLKVALVSTIVATVIGTLAAFALTRFQFRGRSGYSTLIFITLVIPEVVLGIALLGFYRRVADVQLGFRTLVFSHITFCIAFVVVVVKARLSAFDNRLVEAAADLGATPVQSFTRVVLPLAMPGVVAGAMLAFVISIDDVVISGFTSGVGATPLPVYIYGKVKQTVTPEINALSTLILATSLVLLAVAAVFSARAARKGAGAIDATTLA
jgi:spermidine/putrescine transport system permease protein